MLPTTSSGIVVVRLPELNAAAYTVAPFGLTARARGVSPKRVSGDPWMAVPLASKTQTSARPTPGLVTCGSPGRFCPRCAQVMKARLCAVPPKTMSRGSSPTSSVLVTCDSVTLGFTSTMLTLSERKLTTQASVWPAALVRVATDTGSRPTGTSASRVSPPAVMP